MASKTKPGDGRNNPFTTNASPGRAKPFDVRTGTGPAASGKAPPFDQFAQTNPQQAAQYDLAQEVTADGGRVLKADPGNQPSAVDVGTRTEGQSRSGFKLNG